MSLKEKGYELSDRLEALPHDDYMAAVYLIGLDLNEIYSSYLAHYIGDLAGRTLAFAADSGQDLLVVGQALLDEWAITINDGQVVIPYGLRYVYNVFESIVAEVRDPALPPEQRNQYGPAREYIPGALTRDPIVPTGPGLTQIVPAPEPALDSLAHRLVDRSLAIVDMVQAEHGMTKSTLASRRSELFDGLEPVPLQE